MSESVTIQCHFNRFCSRFARCTGCIRQLRRIARGSHKNKQIYVVSNALQLALNQWQ